MTVSLSDVLERLRSGGAAALLEAWHRALLDAPVDAELAAWFRFLRAQQHRLAHEGDLEGPLLSLALAEAPDSPVARAAEQHLARHPPASAWLRQLVPPPGPPGPCLITLSLGEFARCGAVAVHPDGRRVAVGLERGRLEIWDLISGRKLHDLKGLAGDVLALDFSRDGRLLASGGGDRTSRLWDAETGALVREFPSQRGSIRRVVFHGEGQLLTAADTKANQLKVWDVASGALQSELKGHTAGVVDACMLPGARLASSGWDDALRIWDLATGAVLKELPGPGLGWRLAPHPDGRLLIATDQGIDAWDFQADKPRERLADISSRAMVMHPDGRRLLVGSSDWMVHVIDLRGGPERRLIGHVHSVGAVAVVSGGAELVSASEYGTVKLWSLAEASPAEARPPSSRIVTEMAVHPTQPLAIIEEDSGGSSWWDVDQDFRQHAGSGTIEVYSLESGQRLHRLEGSHFPFAFLPGGKQLLSAGTGKDILRWDLQSGAQLARYPDRMRQRDAFSSDLGLLHPDGRRVLRRAPAGEPKGPQVVEVWELERGTTLHRLQGHPGRIASLFVAGERALSVGAAGERLVWDLQSGKALHSLPALGPASVTRLLSDGRVLTAAGKALTLWRLETGEVVRTIKLRGPMRALAPLPDGRRVAAVNKDSLKLFDLEAGKELWRQKTGRKLLFHVRASADGSALVTLGDRWVCDVWDPQTGAHRMTRDEQSNHVTSDALTPGLGHWATIGFDGPLRVWSLQSGQQVAAWMPERSNGVVTFTPRGEVALFEPGGLVLLRLEPGRS